LSEVLFRRAIKRFEGALAVDLPDRFQSARSKDAVRFFTTSVEDDRRRSELDADQPDLTRAEPKTLGPSGGPITGDMNGPEVFATIFAIAPSRLERGTIWTGSDDGIVSVTRDEGKHWTKVTPPGVPNLA